MWRDAQVLEFVGRDLPRNFVVLIVFKHLVRVPTGHQSVSVGQAQRLECAACISMQFFAGRINFHPIPVLFGI